MTLGGLRPFFTGILNTPLLKLKEWPDAFHVDNIPGNILDGAYHIDIGQMAVSTDNVLHSFVAPVTVRMFFKGYRNPQQAKDAALDKAQVILNAVLSPSMRLHGDSNLKNIKFVSMRPIPLGQTNDNAIVLELVFECVLIYRFS
jgi:hypothetical protein